MKHFLLFAAIILSPFVHGVVLLYSIEPAPAVKVVPFTEEYLNAQLLLEAKQRQYDHAEEIASRIFRKNCGDDEFAELVAHASIDHQLPVRIVSALIVVESTCRPGVVSSEGAVGLMQVLPRMHGVRPEDMMDPAYNIGKGTEILAAYSAGRGWREGLHRYNGLGVGCASCDAQYPDKVLLVAGYRQ